jgi:hypothetical protein
MQKMQKFGGTLRSIDQGKTNTKDTKDTKDTKTFFETPVLLSGTCF